jgi:hypothetical protein
MKTKWYHFETEIPPEVEAEGAQAIAAHEAKVFKDRAQAEFGCTYPELQSLVEAEQKLALEESEAQDPKTTSPKEAETRRRTALEAAATRVFEELRRPEFVDATGGAE